MRRGGRRRRRIGPGDAAVSCPDGRWGPKRRHVTQCWAMLRAEDCYTTVLRDDALRVTPGARGEVSWSLKDRNLRASWEIRPNAVWRRGRLLLCCPRCARNCTRLYLPLPDSWLACRRCWGLTYESRTLQNYEDSLWGRGRFARMFGTSQRDWAFLATDEKRRAALKRSRERWASRNQVWRPHRDSNPGFSLERAAS